MDTWNSAVSQCWCSAVSSERRRFEKIYFLYCLVMQPKDLQFSRHLQLPDQFSLSLFTNGKYTDLYLVMQSCNIWTTVGLNSLIMSIYICAVRRSPHMRRPYCGAWFLWLPRWRIYSGLYLDITAEKEKRDREKTAMNCSNCLQLVS